MSKRTSENERPLGDTHRVGDGQRKLDSLEAKREAPRDTESTPVSIISKKVASLWLEKVLQNEYSVTVHPQYGGFPERFLRTLKDREDWVCVVKDEKLVVTSNDPLKIVSLMAYLKSKGYFVEEC
jgi:hypothetical protein